MKAVKVLVLSICTVFFMGHSIAQTGSVADTDRLDSIQNNYLLKIDSIAVPGSLGNKMDIGKDSINSFVDGIKEYNMEELMPGTGLKGKENIPDVDLPIKSGNIPTPQLPSEGLKEQIGDNLLPKDVQGNI